MDSESKEIAIKNKQEAEESARIEAEERRKMMEKLERDKIGTNEIAEDDVVVFDDEEGRK